MGFLRRLDQHLARGNELFDRGNELMDLNREALERNTEAFERHGEAFRDLRSFIHQSNLRGERQTDRLVKELIDLRKASEEQTQAILKLLDRFNSGGGPEIEPA